MTQEQAEEAWEKKRINVFDLTHVWPHGDYPLRTIGKITLNENPSVSQLIMQYYGIISELIFCRITLLRLSKRPSTLLT